MDLTVEEYTEILKKTDALAALFINGECTLEQGTYFLSAWIEHEELKYYQPEDVNLMLSDNILFLIPKENGKAIRLIKAN